ncbi:MAG: MolR family transcriptional regulator, partial [Pseudomonadota bacterium]|nr:MolR family transcriptional regulator [Pseudomonadota bacterium]
MAVKRIHIEPAWSFTDDIGNSVDPQLFRLLRHINESHKLTQAAKQLGISYRHAWNLLNRWSDFFGTEVVVLEKGRGAYLTRLGEKLLWAEQRVAERFKPQMDSLASEINLELLRALDDANPLLRMCASHGYAVALLPDFARGFQLDIQYVSPLESLQALSRGACDVAGFHVPRGVEIPELMQTYSGALKPQSQVAIRYASRK